ncbi:MAG: hypothetical protein AAGA03_11695, partial [Planctomycetota bacterium]
MARRRLSPRRLRLSTLIRRPRIETLDDRRVLAALTGVVFDDVDGSLRQEANESGLAGRLVYLDVNQNAKLDTSEPFALTGDSGAFEFDDVADGDYSVRLYNGTSSQQQTFPIQADVQQSTPLSSQTSQVISSGDAVYALVDGGIDIYRDNQVTPERIPITANLDKIQPLPGGELLVIGNDQQGNHAWRIDTNQSAAIPVRLDPNDDSTGWNDVGLNAAGNGFLISDDASASVRHVQWSDVDAEIDSQAVVSNAPITASTSTSIGGTRSILAWPGVDGLTAELRSNVTGSVITAAATIASAGEVLEFDDAGGLLLLRTLSGGLSINDVDGNFAPLHEFSDLTGPATLLDGQDLLLSFAAEDGLLKLVDLRSGDLLANLPVDFSSVGEVQQLVSQSLDSVLVLGTTGFMQVALNAPGSHEVRVAGDQEVQQLSFGLQVNGPNAAPAYSLAPRFTLQEDQVLSRAAPAGLQGSSDSDGDQYVLLQMTDAGHG